MSEDGLIRTIPPGLGQRIYQDFGIIQNQFIRECLANAVAFAAKHANYCCFRHDNQDYLLFCHDGIPAKDATDVTNSTMVGQTRGQGSSLWGNGEKACAMIAVKRPEDALLVFASHCRNGTFIACEGHPDPNRRRAWKVTTKEQIDSVSKKWYAILRKKVGPNLFNEMKVFYVVRCHPTMTEDFTVIKVSMINVLALMAPTYAESIDLAIVEKQIGRDDYREKINKTGEAKTQAYFVERYASIESSRKSKEGKEKGGTSNTARPYTGLKEFCDRFVIKSFTLKCDPFQTQIDKSSDTSYNITKARVVLHVAAGNFIDHRGIKVQRHVNVRDGKDFEKGKQNAAGATPDSTAALYIPYLAKQDDPDPKAKEAFARYADNALSIYGTDVLMEAMGLPYIRTHPKGSAKQPYVLTQVFIDQIDNVIVGNGHKKVEAVTPFGVEETLQAHPTFVMGNKEIAHRLMVDAAKAAKPNIPAELVSLIEELFPENDEDWAPIGGSGTTERNPDKVNVRIFDLSASVKKGKITEFNSKFKTGESKALLIYDMDRKRPLRDEDISLSRSTRGVTISDCAGSNLKLLGPKAIDIYAQILDEIGVKDVKKGYAITVGIDELSMLDKDDNKVPIKKSEYQNRAGFFPSRSVRAHRSGQEFLIGKVVDVPVPSREEKEHEPSGTGSNTEHSTRKVNLYKNLPSEVFVQWNADKQVLFMNKDNLVDVRPFFYTKGSRGHALLKLINQAYDRLVSKAKGIAEALKVAEKLEIGEHLTFHSNNPSYVDALDCFVNRILLHEWHNDPYLKKIKDQISELRGKIPAPQPTATEEEAA